MEPPSRLVWPRRLRAVTRTGCCRKQVDVDIANFSGKVNYLYRYRAGALPLFRGRDLRACESTGQRVSAASEPRRSGSGGVSGAASARVGESEGRSPSVRTEDAMAWAIRSGFRWVTAAAAVGLVAVVAAGQGPAPRPVTAPHTTWRDYGGSADSMQYSALAQIDRTNVSRLERAWFYPVAGDAARLPFNPIVVDRVMYVAGAKGRRRRARRGDGKAAVDVDRAGSRARSHLLGERRSIRSAAAAQYRRRHPRDRRNQRHAHQVVRQGRIRRHAYRRAATAGRAEQDSRPHLRKPDRCRIQHRRRLRIAARRSARIRRGHGPAGLDVPHHSASGRVRLRDVAARRMEVRRRRQHVGRDHDRQQERHRVRPDRLADARPLRRGSRRRQPVWQLPARPGRADRQAALAFPDGAPRSVGLRPRRRAQAPHRAPQRQAGRDRRAGGQDGIPLRVRAADRKAALANRGAGGAEERRAGRSLVTHAAVSDEARAVRSPGVHARRCESVHERRGAGEAAPGGARHGSQRRVHTIEPSAPSHSVSGRVGRRELGKRGGRSRDRHALRAQPGDAELSPDGAQHGASGTAADQGRPA